MVNGILVGIIVSVIILTGMQIFAQVVAPTEKCSKGEIALAVWGEGYWCVPGHKVSK